MTSLFCTNSTTILDLFPRFAKKICSRMISFKRAKVKAMLLKEIRKILKKHKKDLVSRGVRALSIFGSAARNESVATSDVDILIDFDAKKGLFAFVDLKDYLEKLLTCDVDLVTKGALHPALKQQILREAKYIF